MGCRCNHSIPDNNIEFLDNTIHNKPINNIIVAKSMDKTHSIPSQKAEGESFTTNNNNNSTFNTNKQPHTNNNNNTVTTNNNNNLNISSPNNEVNEEVAIITPDEEVNTMIIPKHKKQNMKYDVTKYPQDILEIINKIRNDPKKYADEIENNIQYIKRHTDGSLIFAKHLKVKLNKGVNAFREAISILKRTTRLDPFRFNNTIMIDVPKNEIDMKDAKVFQDKIIQKKKEIDIHAYFKDGIKDPFISALLMIVDDSLQNPGKKREMLLSEEFKYIAISSAFINKQFCAYFTFAK